MNESNKNIDVQSDGSAIITLNYPISIDGTKTPTLHLRRAKVLDEKLVKHIKDADDRERTMFSQLCGITTTQAEEIDLKDWLVLQEAFQYAKKHCQRAEVQLLDDNIRLSRFWLKQNDRGLWRLQRIFVFEFTTTGEHRYMGSMEIIGNKVTHIELAPFHL